MTVRTATRVGAFLAISLCLGTPQSKAQELSAEADQAFWCAAAYANYIKKDAFTSPEQQAGAPADLSRLEGAMAADAARLEWQQTDVESLARLSDEEVAPQIEDYLRWRDPGALRLSLSDCFPSAGRQVHHGARHAPNRRQR